MNAAVTGLTGQLQSSLGLIAQLKRQQEWFKRQLFDRKSEKRLEFDEAVQASLFAALGIETTPVQDVPTQEVRNRRREKRPDGAVNEQGLRFYASVPVETIMVREPAIEAISDTEREVVGKKVTHRLAQEPGSYKMLRYVRQVVKRRDTGALATPAVPANVLERTILDVSFLAGMLVDKFRYHLPLYRQHWRLADSRIRVSRGSLTNWTGRAIDLLDPVAAAHIFQGAVIAMDETSVKAGRVSPGKMRTGYFCPVYGEAHELVFHYAPIRAHKHVEAFLGDIRGDAVERRLRGLRGLCAPPRDRARTMLVALSAQLHRREGERSAGRGRGTVADWRALRSREGDSEEEVDRSVQAGPSERTRHARIGRVLPPVPSAAPTAGPDADQPVRADLRLRGGARSGASGVPGRPRGEYRQQSSGAGLAPDPGRAAQLSVRVDGTRRPAHRRHSEFDGDVPAARREPIPLPGRCVAAGHPASGLGRHGVDPAGMVDAVRGLPATLGLATDSGSPTSLSRPSP